MKVKFLTLKNRVPIIFGFATAFSPAYRCFNMQEILRRMQIRSKIALMKMGRNSCRISDSDNKCSCDVIYQRLAGYQADTEITYGTFRIYTKICEKKKRPTKVDFL
ncbi:unnamed protein product [Wuchereria bancrofti]|uniref:Uncharacterized protein n=1 Tax=Wuchereria bancrofti TaxID=6293 RepID=A0A3P7FE43_WUCBA|nr:unnamed protein product [Wuchereria bancrofti]